MFLILSHTSVCFPIHQVVRGKHHRIKRLEARHRGLAGSTSMPGFGIVLLTRSAPRPTKAGQGQSGCVSIFRKSTIGFLMFLSCPLRVGLGLGCMFRFYDLQSHSSKKPLVYVILSYTSICLPIYQVVHGKHHRIERTKRCATGSGRTASLPSLAVSLHPEIR